YLIAHFLRGGSLLDSAKYNLILLLVIVISLTIHEFSHAWVANAFGDPTAKNLGRISLNPLRHIDWIGLLLFFLGGYGWAKPVPVRMNNLREPDRGMVIISLAGPLSNIFLAFMGGFLLKVEVLYLKDFLIVHPGLGDVMMMFTRMFIGLNIGLAFFNMFPVPPLDGSKVLMFSFPDHSRGFMEALESKGELILMLLIGTGLIDKILLPLVTWTMKFLLFLFV
ncbi:MAG: site-2 protease family protein, partial [Candidatus Riflebacteria bacterium]|nr:site-2 protease family protein [Candidatus Riflebacteria bacterium]